MPTELTALSARTIIVTSRSINLVAKQHISVTQGPNVAEGNFDVEEESFKLTYPMTM